MGEEHRGAQATARGLWPRREALCFLRGPDAWLGSGGRQGGGAGAGRGATLTKPASVTPIMPVRRRAARMDHVSTCKGAAGGAERT